MCRSVRIIWAVFALWGDPLDTRIIVYEEYKGLEAIGCYHALECVGLQQVQSWCRVFVGCKVYFGEHILLKKSVSYDVIFNDKGSRSVVYFYDIDVDILYSSHYCMYIKFERLHYRDVTWVLTCLKSPTTLLLFVKQLFHKDKGNFEFSLWVVYTQNPSVTPLHGNA